jgi:hypothetical protein
VGENQVIQYSALKPE